MYTNRSEAEHTARKALERGDLAAAASQAHEMVAAAPDRPEGYFLLGMVSAEAGKIAEAIRWVNEAAARGPTGEYLAQQARLLILLRRDGEAAQAAAKSLALEPEDARTFDTIGCVLARLGDHEGAVAPFGRAVEAEPGNMGYRYNLAAACGFTGRTEAAREHYEAILRADPLNARVHYALAILSRQTRANNHVERLEAALDQARQPSDSLRIRYALAKELEDIGDAPRAFHYLSHANEQHKQAIRYDFARDEAIFDAIEAVFGSGSERPVEGGGVSGTAPVFVVGMPRTGTTLVDRILSSHPDLVSAGELQAMPLAIKRLAGTRSRLVIDPETVHASGGIDPAAIGHAYLERARHHLPAGSGRFIDKLPANFLYAGHIARALPEARIVCLRRHPMDTVWSNYKNLFASQSAYYAYSYDLMDTARYYARFDRLMALWDRLFPGRILQLSYEALVADQEGETRRLLDHCGLEWNAACLSFHENAAAVATPSAAQVRRPLNADGIGKWRAHAEAMAPVGDWLERTGIRAG